MVISPENESQILYRYNHNKRPKYQRKDAQNILMGYGDPVLSMKAFTDGIKRARSDVSVNNPQSCDGQL